MVEWIPYFEGQNAHILLIGCPHIVGQMHNAHGTQFVGPEIVLT